MLGARNTVVAKPTTHRGKWRIRWVDEQGRRRSAVFDDYRRAQTELSRRQVEVEEIQRGVRNAPPPEKTLGDLCDHSPIAVRNRSIMAASCHALALRAST